MSTVESIVLWVCLALLVWLLLAYVSVKDGINQLLIANVELRRQIDTLQNQLANVSTIQDGHFRRLREKLFDDED